MLPIPTGSIRPASLALLIVILLGAVTMGDVGDTPQSYADRYREQVYRTNVRPKWLPDDSGFWYRTRTGPDSYEFVWIDASSGQRTVARDAKALGLPMVSELRTSTSTITPQEQSARGGMACRVTFENLSDQSVSLLWINPQGRAEPRGVLKPGEQFRQQTYEGHLWQITDANEQQVARFTTDPLVDRILIDGPATNVSEDRPRPSTNRRRTGVAPDGRWKAEHRGRDVVVTDLESNEAFTLKAPLIPDARYFGPISWSPTSDAFVVSATVPVETRRITLPESSPRDQLQPKSRDINYAKPGDPLPQPVPVLFRRVDGRFDASVIDQTLFSNQYITAHFHQYRWAEQGQEFYFNFNQRGHQCYRILAVNASTGEVRAVVEEVSPTFIDYTKTTWRHWLKQEPQFLWISDRDGWRHLWRFDVDGAQPPRQLTSGPWCVREVVHVDETRDAIWFTANGLRSDEDPYHVHLCRVNLDGTGFRQLTTADGFHEIEFSPQHNTFMATWSRVDHPPVVELRRMDDGSLICEVERADASTMIQQGGVLPERFVAKGRDGTTDIHGVIYRPTHFDPSKSYPIVENVYAGPHGAFTPRQFGTHAKKQDLADLGFIVVQSDGMGTNFRGKEFHDVCWKNLKDAGFPDRIAWIKTAAKTRPWMDLSRVGIYGGSAGGQTAMRALLDHSDFYHVAVADCGCHDNRMDKIWWNEQWMGWPVDEAYRRSSNVEDAAKLKGHLLLIVGEVDTNVDPASTYQVVAALQRAGKAFDFMPLINTGHSAAETPYGSLLRQNFLLRHLNPSRDQPQAGL